MLQNIKDPPGLMDRIKAAQARYDALSPVDRAIHDMEQRRSFVRGQNMDAADPEASDRMLDSLPEFVVLAELKRLRALHPNS